MFSGGIEVEHCWKWVDNFWDAQHIISIFKSDLKKYFSTKLAYVSDWTVLASQK